MTTITNTGIITSFGRTPQAGDDTFAGLINEDATGTIYLDVMANDLGGKGKSLYSLDDADSAAASAKGPYAPQDLLTRDAVGNVNYSAKGAAISITADGKVAYTMTAASTAHFQSLALGQIGLDTFTYAIQMGNGTISWATATVQIMGTNDAPIALADVNSGDEDTTITGTVATNDSDVDNGAVLTYSLDEDVAGLTLNEDGSYSFNAGNAAYQSLAQGATSNVLANYTVTDEHGAFSTSTLTITLTGTNDAPIAVADVDSGLEDTTITGTVATNDSDIDNGAILTYSLNAAVAGLTLNDNGSYSFDAGNAAYQSLAEGVELDVVANYTVTDEFGATSTSTLTITLTGADEAPPSSGDPDPVDFRFNSGSAGGKFPDSGNDNTAEGFTANDTLTFTGYGDYETLTFTEGSFAGIGTSDADTMFVITDVDVNKDGHTHTIAADGHKHSGSTTTTTDTGYLVDYTGLESDQVEVTGQGSTPIVISGL